MEATQAFKNKEMMKIIESMLDNIISYLKDQSNEIVNERLQYFLQKTKLAVKETIDPRKLALMEEVIKTMGSLLNL